MNKRSGDWRLVTLLAILLVVPLASRYLMALLPSIHALELLAYDWHCSSLPLQKPDPRLVYIGMDDGSLTRMGLPANRAFYPLPRTVYAHLVDQLNHAGARVVGFDVMFTRSAPTEDAEFASALKRQALAHTRTLLAIYPKSLFINGQEQFLFDQGLPSPALRGWSQPCSIVASRYIDRVRWFPAYPQDAASGNRYLQMPVGLAASWFGDGSVVPRVRKVFQLGPIRVPVGSDGEAQEMIRYAGPSGTFLPVPLWEAYTGAWRRTHGPNFFAGKIVLVGRFDPLEDRQDTPRGQMAGTEILMNETQTILQGTRLEHWGEDDTYLLKMLLCGVLIAVVVTTGLRWAFLTVVAEALFWLAGSHWLFLQHGMWADLVEPLGALAATYVLAVAAETHRIRLVFHRFMPSRIADQMLRANVNLKVSTAEREATVVFCDVRDFTSMSEVLPLDAVEEILHRYFIAGETAARHNDCEIDKFVGDEIMLFFENKRPLNPVIRERRKAERRRGPRRQIGARKAAAGAGSTRRAKERRHQQQRGQNSHAVRAVNWALEMQEAAEQIAQSPALRGMGFRIGVGVCTGMVRVGTVGARHRIQHTVIGDAVNTASRLQSATKELNCRIVLSQSTAAAITGCFEIEHIGEIRVKGKHEPLQAYAPKADWLGDIVPPEHLVSHNSEPE